MESATQELIIVKAVATLPLPAKEDMGERLKALVDQIQKQEDSVKSNVDKLDRARREEKNGNFLGNWWNDREDAIKEAQYDLSAAVSKLTSSSSELLLINMAISKVLHSQHVVLLKQQNELERQADHIRSQNELILEQQTVQEEQQRDIIAANRGIMEAKGITNDQARRLVDCVVRIEDSEKVMRKANGELRERVEDALASSQARYAEGMARVEEEWKIAMESFSANLRTSHEDAIASFHELHALSSLESARRAEALEAEVTLGVTRERLERAASEAALKSQVSQMEQVVRRMRGALWLAGSGVAASLAWQVYVSVWMH